MISNLYNPVLPLTRREMQILNHIAEGNSNKQIASILNVAEQTVKNHVTAIKDKLNANDRAHAVFLAMHNGLITSQVNMERKQAEKQSSSRSLDSIRPTTEQCSQFDTCHYITTSIICFNRDPRLKQEFNNCVCCDCVKSQHKVGRVPAGALDNLEPWIIEKIRQANQEYYQNRFIETICTVNTFIGHFLNCVEKQETSGKKFVKGEEILSNRIQRFDLPPVKSSIRDSAVIPSPHEDTPFLQAAFCPLPNGKSMLRTWRNNVDKKEKSNMLHSDSQLAERDDERYAWYLFGVWAKQFLRGKFRNDTETLADDMVGVFSQAGPLFSQFINSRPFHRPNSKAVKRRNSSIKRALWMHNRIKRMNVSKK